MNQDLHLKPAGLETTDISSQDLLSFVNDFPALLWRIEIAKSRIEFLNNNYIVARGLDGKLLLKNIRYQQRIVVPEDAYLIRTFMDAMKEGRTAATVFRVRTEDKQTVWLKLTGATNSWDPRYYYGFLLNITDTVGVIKSIVDKDINLQLLVDDSDNPTILLDFESGRILFSNTLACELFDIDRDDMAKQHLNDLYLESMKIVVRDMLDQVPGTRKWTGKLDFYQHGKRNIFTSETIIRYLLHDKRSLLRISFLNAQLIHTTPQSIPLPADRYRSEQLVRDLQKHQDNISSILQTALDSSLVSKTYNAIMFSDVHVKKNKVYVYAVGNPPLDLEQGITFDYKGTIAEDINRFGLSHLTVEDTQESIKPIDWALFVPQGVRSYFAKPFHSRQVLRSVLILCSRTPGTFTCSTASDFDDLLNPLCEAIKGWQRSQRS